MNLPAWLTSSNWLRSRAARRYLRNRLCVAASIIVALYLVVALLIMGGMITLEDTESRVAPGNVPALFQPQPLEKRLEDCQFWLDEVGTALKQNDAQAALGELEFGSQRLAGETINDVERLYERGKQLDDVLASYDDLDAASTALPQVQEFERIIEQLFPPPSGWGAITRFLEIYLGTDRQGRSIALRATYSIKVAVQVGFVTALITVILGSLLGGAAAYFGGWVDGLVIWIYTTFSSIPYLVLLVLVAYMFIGTAFDGTLLPVYVAFCSTFWIGPCRVIRGEILKIKELEYVQAATAIGFGRIYIMIRHALPNAVHLMLINFSLIFIGAIKSEVILTFLGLGVKKGPSWGIMITQSGAEVVNGFFSQIAAATAFMFVLVLAINMFSDAMQDILDPKHE